MQESGRLAIGGASIFVGNPWIFFGVAYAITWSFLLLAIAPRVSFQSVEGLVLQLLALFGPGAVGIGFVYETRGEQISGIESRSHAESACGGSSLSSSSLSE